jgi:hypothetical protein
MCCSNKDRHKLVPSNLDYSLNILEGLRCHYTLPYQNNQVHQHSRLTHNHHQSNRDPGWVSINCDSECSDHGHISADKCICDVSYWGDVCDIPGCPGIGESCTKHGICKLFHEHKVPHMHVQTNEKYTFNKTPTNALDVYFSCKSLLYERIFFETPVIFVAG